MAGSLPKRELKTEENLHYVKPITAVPGVTADEYVLAGDGLTDWTLSSTPNTEDVQYFHEKTQPSNMLGYAGSVSYSGVAYPSDPFNYWIYLIGKNEIVGAQFEEIEVETWNNTEEKKYKAYKRIYEVQPDNPGSGEGGSKLAIEGTFAQQGSVVSGVFDISTKEFTEGGALPASLKKQK